jgi:Mn2+/Fe2+ NRAMP family transporter
MKVNFSQFKRNFLLFFAVLGPGVITAMADNDAGGVATYSVAAATYGMASQYFVILTTILLAITQGIGSKIAVVTGKGLGDLIREYFGARVAVILFLFYFFVNSGVVLQNITGLKSAIQLLGLTWQPWLVGICFFMVLLVIKASYKSLQKVFLITILFYATYLVSAFLSKPDWGEAVRHSLVWPGSKFVTDAGYWFTLVAVLGTTVTAWGQFFVNSYVVDKGLKPTQMKEAQAEVYAGAVMTNIFSWLIAIAVTYTLFRYGVQVTDGFSAANAIRPLAGNLAYLLFAVGLLAASFLGLTIVPLATAYVFTELFGFERTLDAGFEKGKVFYSIFIIQIVLGLLVALIPSINLFKITIYADFLNGAMLPFIFYFLIRFSEDITIMGEYVVKGFQKVFIRAAVVVITIAVSASIIGKIIGKL